MKTKFIAQPFENQIGATVVDLLKGNGQSVKIISAWGKSSGVSRISSALQECKARGGQVDVVIGVDQGGASVEGLQSLHDISDSLYVFHNPARPSRTFHPKVYIFENEKTTDIIIGSGNLTAGGLFSNYEAAVHLTVEHEDDDEGEIIKAEVLSYYRQFIQDTNCCRKMTDDLLIQLQSDPSLSIGSERSNQSSTEQSNSQYDKDKTIFKPSVVELLKSPRVSSTQGVERTNNTTDSNQQESQDEELSNHFPQDKDEISQSEGFYKRLSHNDVSMSSSPGQIIVPIRFRSLFDPLHVTSDETASGGPKKEEATISGTYLNGDTTMDFSGRVILYTPATTHKRPNAEIRFTFRNRRIAETLNEGSYIKIVKSKSGHFFVTQTPTSPGSERFGWLQAIAEEGSSEFEHMSGAAG